MKNPKNLKEMYLKFVIIFAILLFMIGLLLLIIFPKGVFNVIGAALLQLGLTLFIVDLFISNFANKIFRREIIKNFRDVLGITNPKNKLFPELIKVMRPHPYHVLNFVTKNKLIYDERKRNKPYNMAIIEKTTVQVLACEDNVHYHFFRGSEPGTNSSKNLKEIKLNGILLDKDKDLIINENKENRVIEYTVKHKLRNGAIYDFEILYCYDTSMSDLNFGKIKEDSFTQYFIELTNKVNMEFCFPFSLKDYLFMVKRYDACKREKFIQVEPQKNILKVEQENLYNGDYIEIIYRKK